MKVPENINPVMYGIIGSIAITLGIATIAVAIGLFCRLVVEAYKFF